MNVRSEGGAALLAVCLLLTAGCSSTTPMGGWTSSEVRVQSFPAREEALKPVQPAELGALADLPPEEVAAQWEATLESYMATGSEGDLLRLAVLTVLTPPQVDRDQWLLGVLEDEMLSAEEEGEAARGFRRFLRGVLAARMGSVSVEQSIPEDTAPPELEQLRAENARLTAQRKTARQEVDDLQADLSRAQTRNEELQTELLEQEKKVDSLERQIAELKAIEEIIDRRESPSIPQERTQ